MDGPALNEEGRAQPLAQDVAKAAPAGVNGEQLDRLDYIDLGQCLEAKRLTALPLKGLDFCITTRE